MINLNSEILTFGFKEYSLLYRMSLYDYVIKCKAGGSSEDVISCLGEEIIDCINCSIMIDKFASLKHFNAGSYLFFNQYILTIKVQPLLHAYFRGVVSFFETGVARG